MESTRTSQLVGLGEETRNARLRAGGHGGEHAQLQVGLQHELRGSAENEGRVQAHLFVPGFVNTNLAYNYFKEIKGEGFDPEKGARALVAL